MDWQKYCIVAGLLAVSGCSKTDPDTREPGSRSAVMLDESHEHYHVHSADVSHEHDHADEKFTGHGHEHSHPDEATQESNEESLSPSAPANAPSQ